MLDKCPCDVSGSQSQVETVGVRPSSEVLAVPSERVSCDSARDSVIGETKVGVCDTQACDSLTHAKTGGVDKHATKAGV